MSSSKPDISAIKNIQDAYDKQIEAGVIKPDPAQADIVTRLQALQQAICTERKEETSFLQKLTSFLQKEGLNTEGRRGLYLYGGVGRGKTFLMDLFFETIDIQKKTRVHFHDFMLKTHDALHKRRENPSLMHHHKNDVLMDYAAELAQSNKLLCFDEMHVKDITDAMILGRLFTALLQEGIYVVFTSNFPVNDLYKNGLQRDLFLPFLEMLNKNLDVVEIRSDKDYRLNRAYEEGTWFMPLTPESQDKMRHVFNELIAGKEKQDRHIQVKGRDIHVKDSAGRVAWFDFAELCEQPRGASDYLTLCDHFDILLLANVPELNDKMRNETRRFIILIDTLYERGVNIVVSAERDISELYNGKENAFEFDRTISRLTEMQSKSYWKDISE